MQFWACLGTIVRCVKEPHIDRKISKDAIGGWCHQDVVSAGAAYHNCLGGCLRKMSIEMADVRLNR